MSLLLDALKKAAEQKAQKSKAEASMDRPSDETLLDLGAGSAASAAQGDAARNDDTGFDQSGINARLERSSVVRGAGEDTGLDLPDTTDTRIEHGQAPLAGEETGLDIPEPDERAKRDLSEQLQTGDDHSIIFETSDETNFAVEHEPAQTAAPTVEDETDLSQLGEREKLTGSGGRLVHEDVAGTLGDDDETDLSQLGDRRKSAGRGKLPAARIEVAGDSADDDTGLEQPALDIWSAEQGDETDLSQPAGGADSAQGKKMPAIEVDETDLSQPVEASGRGAGRGPRGDADPTDFKQPERDAALIEPAEAELRPAAGPQSGPAEAGATSDIGRGLFDEDLSLLLLEPDPTYPRGSAEVRQAAGEEYAEELALVDTTQTRTRGEPTDTQSPTLTNPSETALYGDQTRTIQAAVSRSNAAAGDATSTRTYAPDNYDRTLMKLPSNDASKLFAGMKPDSDVVMTPDYAKKVFRSKTSAQRAQHYKLYAGVALIIVLSVGLYGFFQYQEESFEIDTSLRPLKRDPLPGVIKTVQPEETSLFAGSDSKTTARTIEIIETAEQSTESAAATESDEPDSAVVVTLATAEPVEVAETTPAATGRDAATGIVAAQGDTAGQAPAEPKPVAKPQARPVATEQAATLTSPSPAPAAQQSTAQQVEQAANNLQITSSSQYRQSDIWLREAYAAYSAGDDQQALRLYNQVLKADPGNRNALLARAAINIQNGEVDGAIRDYQALLLDNPKDSLAMASFLAVASISPLETESQLKLMIYDEPDSPYLNFALANAYGAQNRWHEAQHYYFKALQINPQDPNYAYNLAVSLDHISQPASAMTYYRRSLDNFDNGLATFSRDIVLQRLEKLGNL